MSVASTDPSGPARRAAASDWPPGPAATSRTRLPSRIAAMSSMTSVAVPSQRSITSPQRSHASAASCHCLRVVSLYTTGSNAFADMVLLSPEEEVLPTVFATRIAVKPAGRGRRTSGFGVNHHVLHVRLALADVVLQA